MKIHAIERMTNLPSIFTIKQHKTEIHDNL